MKKMTFMQACADYFGKKPQQTLMEFRKELNALSDKDRDEIKAGLEQNGYEITAAMAGTTADKAVAVAA